MKSVIRDFLPHEKIDVSADSWFEFGRIYGSSTRALTQKRFLYVNASLTEEQKGLIARIPDYYAEFERLAETQIFTVRSVNWLQCYKDLLHGFSEGCALSLFDCIRLQMIDDMGCQTLIVKQKQTGNAVFLHMEEDFSDKGKGYEYRMISAHVGTLEYTYFSYPGTAFGGATMGVNHTTNTFVAADSLYTRSSDRVRNRLWSTALAAVFFMIGDIVDIRTLVFRLKKYATTGIAGSAMHFVQRQSNGTTKLHSIEYGDGALAKVSPRSWMDREYIAQPNLPLSKNCRSIDTLRQAVPDMDEQTEMSAYEMRMRVKRLRQWAKLVPFSFSTISQAAQYLSALCHYSPSDTYEVGNRHEETGFINEYLAAYAFGLMRDTSEEILFGKLSPPKEESSRFWRVAKKQSIRILPGRHFYSLRRTKGTQ